MTNLRQRIKDKLHEKGMSVHAFEKSAGLKQSAVQNILQGRSKRPRSDILQIIARNLNCSVEELLGEETHYLLQPTVEAENTTSDILKNIPWDKELYFKAMEMVLKLTKNTTLPLSRTEILTAIDEIYSYSVQSKKQQIDKRFAEWFLNKTIKPNL